MNWADWTIVAIIGISCLISIWRGFVKEALSLLAWVIATFVAIAFHPRLAIILAQWVDTPSIRTVLAFLLLFIGTLLLGALLNHLLVSVIRASGLGGLDRLLGVGFGVARGLLLVLAVVMFLPMLVPVNQDAWWGQSRFIPHFQLMEGWSRDSFSSLVEWSSSLLNRTQAGADQTVAPRMI